MEHLIVATSTDVSDDPIEALCHDLRMDCVRGSLNDVLDRYYHAAKEANADIILRLTADDPLKDPEVIDKVLAYFIEHPELDYVSNTIESTYPLGLDVEACSFSALDRAWREARLPYDREHVTSYIWKHPNQFKLANITHHKDLSHLRWTVDYEEDIRFVCEVFKRLYTGDVFYLDDILALLDKEPQLSRINAGVAQTRASELPE